MFGFFFSRLELDTFSYCDHHVVTFIFFKMMSIFFLLWFCSNHCLKFIFFYYLHQIMSDILDCTVLRICEKNNDRNYLLNRNRKNKKTKQINNNNHSNLFIIGSCNKIYVHNHMLFYVLIHCCVAGFFFFDLSWDTFPCDINWSSNLVSQSINYACLLFFFFVKKKEN